MLPWGREGSKRIIVTKKIVVCQTINNKTNMKMKPKTSDKQTSFMSSNLLAYSY